MVNNDYKRIGQEIIDEKYNLINNATNLSIYSNNKENTLNYFYDKKINIKA